jgi:hypothetical protein
VAFGAGLLPHLAPLEPAVACFTDQEHEHG